MSKGNPSTLHSPQRWWPCLILLPIMALLVAALVLVSCRTAEPAPAVSPIVTGPTPVSLTADRTPANLPPVIFVMWDWMNGDWGNPNYRFSYIDKWGYRQEYRGHPEYGALGGWTAFRWDQLNPERGYYDWSKTDKYIKDAQAMSVRLPDGSVIAKPVGFAVETWAMEELDNQIGLNYTPYWVALQGGGSTTSCYDPDGSGPCKPFCTPRFLNLTWQYWFDQFILAMGQRYDNNPEFHNLAFIAIATGADMETNERKSFGSCDYYGGNSLAFDNWVGRVMDTYNLAFPNTVQFIQSTLHGIHHDAQRAASYPSKMSGVKVNGLEVDVSSAEIRYNGVLVGGVTGFSEVWHEVIPTGYEPKRGNGIEGSYWFYVQGLSTHPYMFDIQLPNISYGYEAELRTGFPIHDFVRNRLGKTVQNTPDVWIVLRDTYWRDTTWTGSDGIVRTYGPHRGDFSYWLYRHDSAPGSRTVALLAEALASQLPALARNHIYGWHSTRRTDQATGNPYMSFDIDDRYPFTGQIPKAAGGKVTWAITVTLVNSGNDTFSLEYKDYYGNIVERKVTKGPALGTVGQWVDYTWTLDDAYFASGLPGGADFRIDCNNDGNEIIHRLIVSGQGPPPPTPTVTNTRPPTNTPTRTTTPPTPTRTATSAPISTPSPTRTNTRPPAPTATYGPSATPTRTPTLFPPGHNWVTLQQGLRGYQGATDTYIHAWEPTQNYGAQANLVIKNDSVYCGLLRFDLGSIPPGSTVNEATLALYPYNRDKLGSFNLEVYRALRQWNELEANWYRATSDDLWGMAGANDTATDRQASPVAVQTVSALNTLYEFDVTSLVRSWVTSPQTNFGMVLRGRGDVSLVYHFASSQHATISYRPLLMIEYTAPVEPSTPTATATVPTATATPTGTPSGTPGPSPTATLSPIPSPTGTATRTATATGTSLPTSTPTNTVTPFPGGRNVITLQQGVLGYQGTRDTYVSEWNPTSNFAYQANLIIKNDRVYQGLVRFDLSSMPAGSTVNQAVLRVYAYNRDKLGSYDLEVYRVLRPWADVEATWQRATQVDSWGLPGAEDTSTDREANPVAMQNVSQLNTWYEFDITSLVNAWLADPRANYGVLLRGRGGLPLIYHFAAANHPTISLRPQLVIDYTAPATPLTPTPQPPTPTYTRTATRSPTPLDSPTATSTPSITPTSSPTASPTVTATPGPSPTPTPDFESRLEDMEGRAGILEQLIWAIIDIFRRASRIGR